MSESHQSKPNTYTNPVYPHACADPFVLRYRGEYWAYCTGLCENGGAFRILRSPDLVRWTEVGSALDPLPGEHPCYWAPEVSYWNGRFYMYYSVGNETLMQIRVAVADDPAGPFVDSGRRLTQEDFAIDAHVFEDDDGRRYLFYATDYLTHSHIGTGTAVDRLLDPFTLARQPRPVSRARYDWQVYDPQRKEKGGVRWHTVEGPFVLKRKGRYFQMFSGGNWQNITYGVAYAVTDNIDTPDEWQQVVDGATVHPILRTLPGQVIGPGHNSVVRGPDQQQLYCIYHQWSHDGQARVLSIDPLEWVGDRLVVLGPSAEPQPAPLMPRLVGFGAGWEQVGGVWEIDDKEARQTSPGGSTGLRHPLPAPSGVLEVWLRLLDDPSGRGAYGLSLYGESNPALALTLQPGTAQTLLGWHTGETWTETSLDLPTDLDLHADHRLRIEVDGGHVTLTLDETAVRWQGPLGVQPVGLALRCLNVAAAFSGVSLAVGWTDLCMGTTDHLASRGWQVDGRAGRWTVQAGELIFTGRGRAKAVKGPLLDDYELVVNARLPEGAGGVGRYGFCPALTAAGDGPCLLVEPGAGDWQLTVYEGERAAEAWPLPDFNPTIYQQFRFRKQAGQLRVQWEGQRLGQLPVPRAPTQVGLVADEFASFDMVRVSEFV